jgi:uracil-DNA glycosylase
VSVTSKSSSLKLRNLLTDVSACNHCAEDLPLGPRPVIRITNTAKLLIIGQAPGTRVHETGIPWDDPSGDRLRLWLNLEKDRFYDSAQIAIMPMGFCYPGKGRSGDLPPRPECAERWHKRLLDLMPDIKMILLVGSYAQKYYLGNTGISMAERVKDWQTCLSPYFPLVHPSPRNRFWLSKNPWFEREVIPALQTRVAVLLSE